jgi:uncharacterized membrane protein
VTEVAGVRELFSFPNPVNEVSARLVAGGIVILALFGSIGQDRKKEHLLGEIWRDWESRTSFVPFGALLSGRARWRDANPGAVPLIGGLLFWSLATWWHAPLVSPLALILPS